MDGQWRRYDLVARGLCSTEEELMKRLLSAFVAIIYLIAAYTIQGSAGAIKCALFLILPIACIWFSEEMGSFTGVIRGQ